MTDMPPGNPDLKRKERMKMPRQDMPVRDADERRTNFLEVALGYSPDLALKEAERCIQCAKPTCMSGCPVQTDIHTFTRQLREGDIRGALRTIKQNNSLPAICGRVCAQEDQCEKGCLLTKAGDSMAIGRLERFVADWEREQGDIEMPACAPPTGKKVAVVGSGPAGLACAADLAKLGHEVVILEALHRAGGVLVYGIPDFRLPNDVVEYEIRNLEKMGVTIETNFIVGQMATIEELLEEEGYDAVFLGTGAGLPYFLGIDGENLMGVYSANEFLTRVNLMHADSFPEHATPIQNAKSLAVIGAGNVAMDCCRVSKRLGVEDVYCVYRRDRDASPARLEELEHAEEESIDFRWLRNPVEILGDKEGFVSGIKVQKMELGEPDDSGRRRPVPVDGAFETIEVDTVILAIGQGANPVATRNSPDLALNKWGNIIVDDNLMTNLDGVFAGGDIVTGAATVIRAMGAGKEAAAGIHNWLMSEVIEVAEAS